MNATVNTLKLIATVLVAVCHCWIICNQEFGFELQDNWQILLKTPAWGGVFMFFTISGYLAQSSISKYVVGGDCPRTQIPIGGNLQIESERPDDMGKTSESLAELGGNQSGYAQEISNRKFETPSNGVIGRPGGGRPKT